MICNDMEMTTINNNADINIEAEKSNQPPFYTTFYGDRPHKLFSGSETGRKTGMLQMCWDRCLRMRKQSLGDTSKNGNDPSFSSPQDETSQKVDEIFQSTKIEEEEKPKLGEPIGGQFPPWTDSN